MHMIDMISCDWLLRLTFDDFLHDLQWGLLHVELLGSSLSMGTRSLCILHSFHFNVDKNGESKDIYFELRLWWDVKLLKLVKLDLKPFTLHLLFTSSVSANGVIRKPCSDPYVATSSGVRRAKTQVGTAVVWTVVQLQSGCKVGQRWYVWTIKMCLFEEVERPSSGFQCSVHALHSSNCIATCYYL